MLRRVMVVLAGVLVLGALGAGPAFAGLFFPFDGQLAPSGGSFGGLEAGSVAVDDANGNTYVADSGSGTVSVFETASGTQLASLDGSLTPAGSFGGGRVEVAANNGTGEVYVLDSTDNVVDVFEAGGSYACQITASATPSATECNGIAGSAAEAGPLNDPGGIAVDQATGDIYVVDAQNSVVDVFSPEGAYVRDISLASIPSGFGSLNKVYTRAIAVDDFSGDVLVADSGIDGVYVFNAAGGYETTWTGSNTPAESFGGFYVSVAADNGNGNVYVLDSQHGVVDVLGPSGGYLSQFSRSFEAPLGTAVDQASGKVYVSDETVIDIFGPGVIPPPSVTGEAAVNLTLTSADLTAHIDPNGLDTTYRFEYGTSTAYGASAPVPDGAITGGAGNHVITQRVSGLQASTTYHWRVVAHSAVGTTTGIDHTFIYDTSGEGLADHRAYEMVTPSQKNGALIGVTLVIGTPLVAEDGSRVVANSVQCFAGARSCTGNRGSIGSPVVFSRTSGGWAPSVPAPPASVVEENSSLYSSGTGAVLFSGPMAPAGEEGFFGREPDGSLVEIGPAYPPSYGQAGQTSGEVESTADLSHVIYASSQKWPFDATASGINSGSLYEYEGVSNPAPVLVGVSGGRGSTDLISVCGTAIATPGMGRAQFYNSLSADGGVVFFGPQPCSSGSGVNAGVAVQVRALYARLDESRTVLISGRSPLGCTGACLSSVPRDAVFQGASSDGSRVFFTSRQRLTDSASEGQENLYEYDFARPAGDNLIALSVGDTSGGGPGYEGMEAISPDGSHVYFVAGGVLTGAANSQGQLAQAGANNLYVYERDAAYPQGRIGFIVALPGSDREFELEALDEDPGFPQGLGQANVTPEGRFLVFMSHGQLTPDDHHDTVYTQAFRYDAQTGELARVSVGEQGFNDNGNAGLGNVRIVPSYVAFPRSDPTMSHDGSYVFFESPVALTPRALNDVQVGTYGPLPTYATNVYEWHEGHVSLISDGRDTSSIETPGAFSHGEALSSVQLLGNDASGANVFFATSDRLVPQDTDTARDYYDARICSASSPCVAPPEAMVGCAGEACRGVPAGVPGLPTALSSTFSGAGNSVIAPRAVKARQKAKAKRRKAKHRRKRRSRSVGKRGRAKGSSRSIRRSK